MSVASTQTFISASQRLSAFQAGIAAVMFGALIVGIVGFASPQAIHDAAHDTRHANIAPCH